MRARWLLLGWMLAAPAWADDLADMNAVSKAWDRYAELSHADKPEAVDLLAASSLAHFGFLRDAALYASAEQLRRIPSADRMIVYVLRASQTQEQLSALDNRAVARLCMQRGWIGVNGEEGEPLISLSHVTVMDALAVAELAPPTESQYQFGPEFAREGQAWRFRYESLVLDNSGVIDQALQKSAITATQMYESVIAQFLETSTPPSLAVLDRPLLDDATARVGLNEQWPDYEQAYAHRIAAVGQKARQGDSFAELVYGTLQVAGNLPKWVPKDEASGLALLEKSSEAGNAKAAELVFGYLAADPKALDDARLRRITPHLQRAADGGSANAMGLLGTFYFAGAGGLQRDCQRAAEWQARAEEAGADGARNDLVWTWATCPIAAQRDPAKALQLAQHLIKQKDTLRASELDTVAAALAANGRFEEAAQYQQLAIEKSQADLKENPNLGHRIKRMQARLAGYRKGRDYLQEADIFADMRAGRY